MIDWIDICRVMGQNDCNNCGDYAKWQPCKESIPEYISKEQIRKWLIARRLKNV